MHLSRIPSLALLLVGSAVVFAPQLHAGASNKNGNPFGNGTFFQTTGTFSAVIRGENLSGTMLFSTGVNTNGAATNTSGGSTTISYLGSSAGARAGMYIGNAAGMWDPSSGSISGQIWGGQKLSGTNSTTVYPEIYNNSNNPNWTGGISFPVPIETVSNNILTIQTTDPLTGVVTITTTNIVQTNVIYVMPYGSNNFNDTAFISGNFSGSTQNKYPNQTFTAQGTLIQQELMEQAVDTTEGTIPVQMAPNTTIPVTVQGVRVSDNYSTFNAVSNSVPYSMTAYSITNFANFGQQQ
jgi:hypothetical protein